MPQTLFMVVENFKNNDAVPVYRRFKERGRMAPEGLNYISSWVDHNLTRCYQVMQAPDRALLDQWIANWSDLIDFEVHPVITSKEAAERVGLTLRANSSEAYRGRANGQEHNGERLRSTHIL